MTNIFSCSMRDCVEVSRVSRAASDAAWNRSCRAERRWGSNMRFHGGAGLPAGEAQRSGAGGWEWTLPETFSWYTPELGGLLLMLTGVGWTDRACIKCSAWSDHVFWRSVFVTYHRSSNAKRLRQARSSAPTH